MLYAIIKGADQPAYPRSLISTFVVRCLDSIISLVFISEISRLYVASVTEQAGLNLTWSQTPKTGFLVTGLRCYRRLLNISYKDHATNEEIRNSIQDTIGVHYDLLNHGEKAETQMATFQDPLTCRMQFNREQ